MRAIGFDLGSSFIKGAILDLDELTLSHVVRLPFPNPVKHIHSAFREFDPIEILDHGSGFQPLNRWFDP